MNKQKGFTLIELLLVLSIIGLLSAVLLNATQSAREKARNKQRLQQIDQIEKAFSIWMTLNDKTTLPTTKVLGTQYFCLGKGGYYTVNSNRQCDSAAGGTFNANTYIDTIVKSVLASGMVPGDPSLKLGFGNAYIYISDTRPVSGECNATTCPRGAYLIWIIENSSDCGRGMYYELNNALHYLYPGTNGLTSCYLRIGDAS